MVISKEDWKQAILGAEGMIKEGEMLKIQGEMLLARATKECGK